MDIPRWLVVAARLNGEAVYEVLKDVSAHDPPKLSIGQVGRVLLDVRADKLAYLIEEPDLREPWMKFAAARFDECVQASFATRTPAQAAVSESPSNL